MFYITFLSPLCSTLISSLLSVTTRRYLSKSLASCLPFAHSRVFASTAATLPSTLDLLFVCLSAHVSRRKWRVASCKVQGGATVWILPWSLHLRLSCAWQHIDALSGSQCLRRCRRMHSRRHKLSRQGTRIQGGAGGEDSRVAELSWDAATQRQRALF